MKSNSRDWLAPLTGLGFIAVGILSFIIGGEPKSADDPAREIVAFYVDNKDSVQVGAIMSVAAGVLLVFFGAYLRDVLRSGRPEVEGLSLVAFMGFVVVAVGLAIDATILIAASEAADDIPAASLVALQALWDNDFVPLALGVELFLWGTGLAVVRTGVLPKWLGWLMIVLAIAGLTPIGFVAAIGSALLVLILSIWLSLRARGPAAPATQ